MNTQTCITRDRSLFDAHLCRLMVEDGFGPDEALDHATAYAGCIFTKPTPTAVLRVRHRLAQMYREALAN